MAVPKGLRAKTKALSAMKSVVDKSTAGRHDSGMSQGENRSANDIAAHSAAAASPDLAAVSKTSELGGGAEDVDTATADQIQPMSGADMELASPAAVLSQTSFQIRLVQWSSGEGGVVRTFISSKDLEKKNLDARTISLEAFRALIPAASKFSSHHKFCSPSGMTIPDETVTFEEYLAIDPAGSIDGNGGGSQALKPVPAVKLFFKADAERNDPPDLSVHNEKYGRFIADLTSEKNDSAVAKDFVEKVRTSLLAEEKDLLVSEGAGSQRGPGSLTEAQWSVVMRNCGVLYGWFFDRRTRQVIQAPKQAFRLRPQQQTISVKTMQANSAQGSAPPEGRGSHKDQDSQVADDDDDDETGMEENIEDASEPGENSSDIEDKHAMSGHGQDNQSSTGTTKRSHADLSPAAVIEGSPGVMTLTATASFPNYRLNDNSKIDVTACSHEYELSMARNDFSSTSVEATASGGYGGVSASVSAGFAQSSESSSKSTSNNFQSIMVAKYLYPRCDLIFEPDDLEPTDDFKAAIDKVRTGKDINDLRKLHSTYGQLFCGKVTLGGRLLSTKVMTETTESSEQSQKEDFKVSVGVSVSTPFGGGGVKADHSKGSSTAVNETNIDRNEQQVFEAVGGDTILANNPALWAPTVGNYRYWRVIDRDELTPMVDLLSKIPGYEDVKTMFIRAVPALDGFVTLDASHEAIVRLKVTAPTNGMSSLDQNQVVYFLGHRSNAVANPRANHISRANAWRQVDGEQQYPIFRPAAYQAPALLGYLDNKVGPVQYGANYNKDFLETQWSIVAPFDQALTHGSRVILRTRQFRDPLKKASVAPSAAAVPSATPAAIPGVIAAAVSGATASTPAPPPPTAPEGTVSHMVVFRNQQGVFLPAMSDNDEVQYWRILKKDPATPLGTHIRDGEDIRLCWTFNDQTTGFRDFTDDVFGRRRNTVPSDVSHTVLYLKLPFPRFESINHGDDEPPPPHHMMMAPMPDLDAQYHHIERLGMMGKQTERIAYYAQDLSFRIDKVSNDGYGDSEDYLLRGLTQDQDIVIKNASIQWVQFSGKVSARAIQHDLFWMIQD